MNDIIGIMVGEVNLQFLTYAMYIAYKTTNETSLVIYV